MGSTGWMLAATLIAGMFAPGVSAAPLELETTIRLPDVSGRIDHMAVDLGRGRLLVAELGNGTVDAVDLASGRMVHRISGLEDPQGIAYVPATDNVVVASAGDGSVRFYRGEDLALVAKIDLGEDADNVRVDPTGRRVFVGYGSGGLAIIEPQTRTKIGDVPLAGHPEGFQLAPDDLRAFVNVPDARQIAVIDLAAGKQTGTFEEGDLRSNFPMAIDATGHLLATVFRSPARAVLMDTGTGMPTAQMEACDDADDVFFDTQRHRMYVSCGSGAVDVFGQTGSALTRIARVESASGGRTSLFVPRVDRLFVAVRAGLLGGDAKILVFRPMP